MIAFYKKSLLVILLCVSQYGFSVTPVSIIRLLIEPERYHNVTVEVFGYLGDKPELRLYLTEEHAKNSDINSSIKLIVSQSEYKNISKCAGGYIYIRGLIENESNEGVLKKINKIITKSKSCDLNGSDSRNPIFPGLK